MAIQEMWLPSKKESQKGDSCIQRPTPLVHWTSIRLVLSQYSWVTTGHQSLQSLERLKRRRCSSGSKRLKMNNGHWNRFRPTTTCETLPSVAFLPTHFCTHTFEKCAFNSLLITFVFERALSTGLISFGINSFLIERYRRQPTAYWLLIEDLRKADSLFLVQKPPFIGDQRFHKSHCHWLTVQLLHWPVFISPRWISSTSFSILHSPFGWYVQ